MNTQETKKALALAKSITVGRESAHFIFKRKKHDESADWKYSNIPVPDKDTGHKICKSLSSAEPGYSFKVISVSVQAEAGMFATKTKIKRP